MVPDEPRPYRDTARLLFQFARDDFFIAGMTGREFFGAASEPKELKAYEGEHAVHHPDARVDRLAFLSAALQATADVASRRPSDRPPSAGSEGRR